MRDLIVRGVWIASLALAVAGCSPATTTIGGAEVSSAPATYSGPGPIGVTCTVGMLADLVRAVGGNRLEVTTLMGPGTDPHLYKTSPGDVKQLGAADLVLYCGHHLEGKMGDTLERVSRRTPTVAVCERIDPTRLLGDPEAPDAVDPHLWFDVTLWREAADVIRAALAAFDPSHASAYEDRARALATDLTELDRWVRDQIARIPENRRVLVTAHDAFRYFGRAYGVEVLAIQGLSTDSEASVQKVNELVSTIVERGIRAVFVESTVSAKNIRSLVEGCAARGHTVAIGGSLFSDAMGAAGTPGGTYSGMVRHNVQTIVEALK
ncbi:MAG: metal ABC transporter solute-binding protein, Zn/Mn family [Planctomycetota bacterium]